MSALETVTPILGVNAVGKDTTAKVAPGTPVHGKGGRVMLYVQASGVIAAGGSVTVSTSTLSFTASSVAVGSWTNSSVAFADAEYGWVFKNV